MDHGGCRRLAGCQRRPSHLAVALCVLNDTYREVERLGVTVDGVAIEADGSFDDQWRSTGIEYSVTLDSRAPAETLEHPRLGTVVDEVAEIPGRSVRVRQSEACLTSLLPGSALATRAQRT